MANQTKSKAAAKSSKAKKAANPPFLNMIQIAIKAVNEKKGVSRVSIKKYIAENFHIDFKQNKNLSLLNRSISKALKDKTLRNGRTSGLFKLAKEEKKAKKSKPKAVKTKKAKKAKSAQASKAKKASKTKVAKPKSVKSSKAKQSANEE